MAQDLSKDTAHMSAFAYKGWQRYFDVDSRLVAGSTEEAIHWEWPSPVLWVVRGSDVRLGQPVTDPGSIILCVIHRLLPMPKGLFSTLGNFPIYNRVKSVLVQPCRWACARMRLCAFIKRNKYSQQIFTIFRRTFDNTGRCKFIGRRELSSPNANWTQAAQASSLDCAFKAARKRCSRPGDAWCCKFKWGLCQINLLQSCKPSASERTTGRCWVRDQSCRPVTLALGQQTRGKRKTIKGVTPVIVDWVAPGTLGGNEEGGTISAGDEKRHFDHRQHDYWLVNKCCQCESSCHLKF